ncbi:SNRK kinase, partial [Atractosteus spatula]|nr:SNRK kinase [Atractosteus spatula]
MVWWSASVFCQNSAFPATSKGAEGSPCDGVVVLENSSKAQFSALRVGGPASSRELSGSTPRPGCDLESLALAVAGLTDTVSTRKGRGLIVRTPKCKKGLPAGQVHEQRERRLSLRRPTSAVTCLASGAQPRWRRGGGPLRRAPQFQRRAASGVARQRRVRAHTASVLPRPHLRVSEEASMLAFLEQGVSYYPLPVWPGVYLAPEAAGVRCPLSAGRCSELPGRASAVPRPHGQGRRSGPPGRCCPEPQGRGGAHLASASAALFVSMRNFKSHKQLDKAPRKSVVRYTGGHPKPTPCCGRDKMRAELRHVLGGGSRTRPDTSAGRAPPAQEPLALVWPLRGAAMAGFKRGYDGKIAGLYDLDKTLGRGHFAVVKLARHVFTGEKVAVKVIDKTKLDTVATGHLFQEVRCMKLVQHPNIVRLYEVIDTQTKLYLILELGDGGDMFDYIMKHEEGLSEEVAKKYFAQIVHAISYCHRLHVVHRDLKPENVVFFEKQGLVKLTDFGFSNKFQPGKKLTTSCGSLAYSAPEILLGDEYDAPAVGLCMHLEWRIPLIPLTLANMYTVTYGTALLHTDMSLAGPVFMHDIWSLGVILFMLVCGQPPFQEANDSETLTMIMDCKYTVPSHVSRDCKDLINRMLQRDPKRRASLDEIESHAWLQGVDPSPATKYNIPLVSHKNLSEEEHNGIIQRMVLGDIADREAIIEALETNKYNHITATYFLLAERILREKQEKEIQNRSSSPSNIKAQFRQSWPTKIDMHQDIEDSLAASSISHAGGPHCSSLLSPSITATGSLKPGAGAAAASKSRTCLFRVEEDEEEEEEEQRAAAPPTQVVLRRKPSITNRLTSRKSAPVLNQIFEEEGESDDDFDMGESLPPKLSRLKMNIASPGTVHKRYHRRKSQGRGSSCSSSETSDDDSESHRRRLDTDTGFAYSWNRRDSSEGPPGNPGGNGGEGSPSSCSSGSTNNTSGSSRSCAHSSPSAKTAGELVESLKLMSLCLSSQFHLGGGGGGGKYIIDPQNNLSFSSVKVQEKASLPGGLVLGSGLGGPRSYADQAATFNELDLAKENNMNWKNNVLQLPLCEKTISVNIQRNPKDGLLCTSSQTSCCQVI